MLEPIVRRMDGKVELIFREEPADSAVDVQLPAFWSGRMLAAQVWVDGSAVARVVLDAVPDSELEELCLLEWWVVPAGSEPGGVYGGWPLEGDRVLVVRYPGADLPEGKQGVLPSSWVAAAGIAAQLSGYQGTVPYSCLDFEAWRALHPDVHSATEAAAEFARDLRLQRELPALLEAIGLRVLRQRMDPPRLLEAIDEYGIEGQPPPQAIVSALGELPHFEGPYLAWLTPRPGGGVAGVVVSAHSAQPWLGERAPVDYVLAEVRDEGGRALARLALWFPYLLPLEPSGGLDPMVEALEAEGVAGPERVQVVPGVHPVLVDADATHGFTLRTAPGPLRPWVPGQGFGRP